MTKHRAITLVEILVSIVLIGIAVLALGTALVSGKHLIKLAEDDGRALSLALAKKEALLTRAYDHSELCSAGTSCTYYATEDIIFKWTTVVTNKQACDSAGSRCIPYKGLIARVDYPEQTISGVSSGITKQVVLKDIVPFPKVHLKQTDTGTSPCTIADGCGVTTAWSTVGSGANSLRINLPAYPVNKDLLVIYNIAINVEDAAGPPALESDDLILTRCRLDGVGKNPETGTPILSQAVITNVLRIPNVAANTTHILDIQWRKDTASGGISIRRANLVVIAFEI